jgi:hypothetical protein
MISRFFLSRENLFGGVRAIFFNAFFTVTGNTGHPSKRVQLEETIIVQHSPLNVPFRFPLAKTDFPAHNRAFSAPGGRNPLDRCAITVPRGCRSKPKERKKALSRNALWRSHSWLLNLRRKPKPSPNIWEMIFR